MSTRSLSERCEFLGALKDGMVLPVNQWIAMKPGPWIDCSADALGSPSNGTEYMLNSWILMAHPGNEC